MKLEELHEALDPDFARVVAAFQDPALAGIYLGLWLSIIPFVAAAFRHPRDPVTGEVVERGPRGFRRFLRRRRVRQAVNRLLQSRRIQQFFSNERNFTPEGHIRRRYVRELENIIKDILGPDFVDDLEQVYDKLVREKATGIE